MSEDSGPSDPRLFQRPPKALPNLAGRAYGPVPFRVGRGQVAAYVEATGDDPERWGDHAPPSFAGAALFKVATPFLGDPEVAPHARLLIHGEQTFIWRRPWRIGARLTISAQVDRVRERAGTAFVTFGATVADSADREVLSSRSLFLMSSENSPGGETPERSEPVAEARRANSAPRPQPLPGAGESLAPLAKSVSRLDLVRYAAASEDFNPVHWDHVRAVESGVGGVICHGLLMAAWATQPAAASSHRPDPLAKARFRFRRPLYPDRAARVVTTVKERSGARTVFKATVSSDAGDHVLATIETKADEGTS